jgi:hypothetical protein
MSSARRPACSTRSLELNGDERPVSPRYTQEGAQYVIPGAERISDRELIERHMGSKLLPRRGQQPAERTPLFRLPR